MTDTSPIFVLGIMRRSGTNYLGQLLSLHPDIEMPRIAEDYVVGESHALKGYVRAVYQHWNPSWGFDPDSEELLLQHMGQGVLGFLASQIDGGRRLLVKTPSVTNLEHFFHLFPAACLILLVRDGRDVTESGMRTFGWRFEAALQAWVRGARTIRNFVEAEKPADARVLIVRYRDLCYDTEAELRKLLRFLRADPTRYDWETALELPVSGSSTFRGGAERVHWNPIPRSPAFKPVGRWQRWGAWRKQRFLWVAGQDLAHFGYLSEEERAAEPGLYRVALNRLLDAGVRVGTPLYRVLRGVV